MRGALAVVTLALSFGASCQDLHGVEVIVQPGDPAVTSVRVFVGTGGATNSSLTTSANVQVDDVNYWSRDPNNESDVVTGVDGTAEVRFLFGTSDTIPAVIAIGFDANHTPIAAGALTDLELRDGEYTGYELPLAGPIAPLGTMGATVQLGLWSPDRATSAFDAACAGIVVAGADHPSFVVTDNDQDCDGLTDDDTDHECTPDVYLGTRGADPSEASCLVANANPVGPQCKLGGATCTDNVPRDQNACVAGHTCTLAQLCTACGMSYDCAADTETQITKVDHYECALARKPDNSICETTFTLARPPTGGYGCTDFVIGDASTPLGTTLTVGGVELDASVHDSPTSSCAGKLAAKGESSAAMIDFAGFVSFTLKNNAGVALPIHFTAAAATTTTCPAAADCALVSAMPLPPVAETFQPALTACATAWNAPAPVTGLFTGNTGDSEPTLSADQLEMIYVSNGTLYRTTRTAIGGMWAASVPIQFGTFTTPPNATFHSPELSPDGVALFFAMVDPASTTTTMLYMTRSSATTPQWNMPAAVIYADAGFTVTQIAWAPNGHVVVGLSPMTGDPEIDDATFDVNTKTLAGFTTLVTGAGDPYLTADGMHLYYATSDTGGAVTLFVASRRTPLEGFGPAVQLPELSSATSKDTGPWVPAGGHTIYFASQRGGSTVPAIMTALRASF